MWLFSWQALGLAVQVPQDPGYPSYTATVRVCVIHSMLLVLKRTVSELEFDGSVFVTNVVYDLISVPRDR
jgi:hypothetical protein